MQANSSTSSSKRKGFKNHIFRALVFMLILGLLIVGAGELLEEMHDDNISDKDFYPAARWEEYYGIAPNTIDLLFLGSSHSYKSFDTEIFDERIGTNSFNMGHSAQLLDSSYYILREVLRNQKPDTVVLEVYFKMMESDHMIFQNRYCYDYMEDSDVKKEFWKDVFKAKDKFEYAIKVLRYRKHLIKWLTGTLNETIDDVDSREYYKSKGFVYTEKTVSVEDLKKNNIFSGYAFGGFSDIQYDYLKRIISLCESENITLVMVSVPLPETSLGYIGGYDVFSEGITELSKENDIFYIDYNSSGEIREWFDDDMFSDYDHLNYTGVKTLDNHFIEYLLSNGLADINIDLKDR